MQLTSTAAGADEDVIRPHPFNACLPQSHSGWLLFVNWISSRRVEYCHLVLCRGRNATLHSARTRVHSTQFVECRDMPL